ncbi:MAG: hypothetical protein NT115_05765 [Proteobacteria bacterium]|nr:hypothetical protein [Pseudomonadota bacterium]
MSDLNAPEFQPERHLFTSRAEYVAGFEQVLSLARHELRIFDPDLSQLPLNTTATLDKLRDFISRQRDNRVYIALHKPELVARQMPRLMNLLVFFSGSVLIHQTEGDAARVQDCFTLADNHHFVRRPVWEQPRGVLVLNDDKEAHKMRERFDEIWQSSVPAVSASTSGL